MSDNISIYIHTITVWHLLYPASHRHVTVGVSYDALSHLLGVTWDSHVPLNKQNGLGFLFSTGGATFAISGRATPVS